MKTLLGFLSIVFALPGAVLGQVLTVNRLVPSLAAVGEKAGGNGEVAIGCGQIAIGLPGAVNPKTGVATGAVALFDAKTFKELPPIFPPTADANAGMEFGYAVAISGSVLVIGAPGADDSPAGSENRGAAYVYDLKAKKFLRAKIQDNFFMLAGERYGQVVGVDGDWVAISSPQSTGISENLTVSAGAVYLTQFQSAATHFISPDSAQLPGAVTGVAGDDFGASVVMRGNLLVIGSPGATVGGNARAGRVTVVSFGPTENTLLTEIDNPAPAANEEFGRELALGSRHLLIGAPGDEGGNGKFFIRDARLPLTMPYVSEVSGTAVTDEIGKALATEGNRLFYNSGGLMGGQTFFSPFDINQTYLTWDEDGGDYGADMAVGDGLVVVGAPGWNGDTGSVVVHETRQIESPDFYPSQFTDSSAPEHPVAGTTLADFVEVAANLQAPTTYPAGNPLYIGKLAGAGAKTNPLGVFVHDSSESETNLIGVALSSLYPTISRPIGNGVGRWWWRVTYKANKLPDFFSSDGNNSTNELHNGSGDLWGVNLPLKAADELRVDNVLADAAIVTLRLKVGGAVNAGNDSGVYSMEQADVMNQGFLIREEFAFGPGVLVGEIAPRVTVRDQIASVTFGLTGSNVNSGNNQRLLLTDVVPITRGDAAPGVRNSTGSAISASFSSFTAEAHNASSGVFRATINPTAGVTPAVNEGLWSNRNGSLGMVMQKGQQAPVLATGVKVTRILNFAIMTDNDILILAQVAGPGIKPTNDVVLYLSKEDPMQEPGYIEILAREGDRLPGTKGAKIGSILRLEVAAVGGVNAFNRYGILCSLVTEAGRVTPADNLVWMVGDALPGEVEQKAARQPLPKLRKGEASTSYGPGYEKLSSIAFPAVTRDASGALLTGMAHVLDPRHGGSTGVVTFPNKRKAVTLIW
jgi:hypothetical protein